MNGERNLRVALSESRGTQSFGRNLFRGSVTGFVALTSLMVVETFTRSDVSIAAISSGPDVMTPSLIKAPAAPVPPLTPFVTAEAPRDLAAAAPDMPFIASLAERRRVRSLGQSQEREVEVAAINPGPASPKFEIAIGAGEDIIDPPRERAVSESQSTAPRSVEQPQLASAAPDIASIPLSPDAEAVRRMAQPGDATAQPIQIAESSANLKEFPAAPSSPSVSEAMAEPNIVDARVAYAAEISLTTTDAFDFAAGPGASFAALVDPRLDAPSTPELNVDPAVSFNAPLDMLQKAPHAWTPQLKAPAVVAVLGAQPPIGFAELIAPGDIDIAYRNDSGRAAARWEVMSDGDMDWRRYAVAPRHNPENLPVMAIVIDEIGAYGAPVEDVAALSPMVSVSVIPSTEGSAEIAEKLRDSGREVLVHMPMETYADFKEGPHPILKKMTDEEVRDTARWHLSQFSGFVGVNNHLGSKVTRDKRVMGVLMSELSTRGLMFLDSRTSTKSIAEQVAQETGILATRNHRFIDNEISVEAVMRELNAAAAHARRHGAAVAIGNPNPATISAVKKWLEVYDGKRILVAPISHVASVLSAPKEEAVAGR